MGDAPDEERTPDEEHTEDLDGFEEAVGPPRDPTSGPEVELRETFHVFWKDVKGCCAKSRIQAEVKDDLENWLKKKRRENPDFVLVRYGSGSAKVTCRK